MRAKEVKKVNKIETEIKAITENTTTSKSSKMKDLFLLGLDVKEIAQIMGTRYNFVYNVISNMIITDGVEVIQDNKESKKDTVLKLHKENKTPKEIAIELKTNLNYIYKVIGEYKMDQEAKAE